MTKTSRKFLAGISALATCIGAAAIQTAQAQTQILPDIHVTASRLGEGITGASTTVITAEEIARTPAESLQDIISRAPGVQTWSTFGGVSGARIVANLWDSSLPPGQAAEKARTAAGWMVPKP